MDVKPTADMALKYKGVIVGIKSAHFNGPEWTPYIKAEEVGKIAHIPVMVDFGGNVRAGRTLVRSAEQIFPSGRHFHAHVRRAPRRTGSRTPRAPARR